MRTRTPPPVYTTKWPVHPGEPFNTNAELAWCVPSECPPAPGCLRLRPHARWRSNSDLWFPPSPDSKFTPASFRAHSLRSAYRAPVFSLHSPCSSFLFFPLSRRRARVSAAVLLATPSLPCILVSQRSHSFSTHVAPTSMRRSRTHPMSGWNRRQRMGAGPLRRWSNISRSSSPKRANTWSPASTKPSPPDCRTNRMRPPCSVPSTVPSSRQGGGRLRRS